MKNLNFLGENWWQGVGVISSAILAIIAIVITIRQNNKKRLSYEIQISEPLFDIHKELITDLKLIYKGLEVKQINLFQIKIINNGQVPIRKGDFNEHIELELKSCKTFFDIVVKDCYPNNLKLDFNYNDGVVRINPMLINPNEFFILRIIFDGEDRKFEISSRIEGISSINNLAPLPYEAYQSWLWTLLGSLIGITFGFSVNEFHDGNYIYPILALSLTSIIIYKLRGSFKHEWYKYKT